MNQSLGLGPQSLGLGLETLSLGLVLGLETHSLGLGLVDPSLDYITDQMSSLDYLQCFDTVSYRKGIRPAKNWVLVCWR